jgi:hypothetical protein
MLIIRLIAMFKIFGKKNSKNTKIYKNYKKSNQTSNPDLDRVIGPNPEALEAIESQTPKPKFSLNLPKKLKINTDKLTIIVLAVILFGFCGYLLVVDKYFLVKNIDITFAKGSYLSRRDAVEFKKSFESSYLNLIAKNQIWFISSPVITTIAREINSEIADVEIIERILPNTLKLKISTQPILATLNFNNNQSWRISKTGRFTTQDDIGLQDKPVNVTKPIIWNTNQYDLSKFNIRNINGQLNRLYFIEYTNKLLQDIDLNIVKSNLETIDDTQTNIITTNDTQLLFDSENMNLVNHTSRVKNVLTNTKIQDSIRSNKMSYIDFRIPENVFLCYKGSKCSR